ncbi:MAG: DUF2975 domain-containing protein [Oscillospiraceae bacterium]|nr:DUF2975 domain-containing protein [Oscillospiraceae bacterium]
MWNENKSLVLSKIAVIAFMVLLLACAVLAPRLVARLIGMSAMANAAGSALFLWTLYVGCIPAGALLVNLYMLLRRISAGSVFVKENVSTLRLISWCLFVGGIICIASSLYYAPWLPIGIAAAFMGLVVCVVKNVIAKAVSLQDDADYTI